VLVLTAAAAREAAALDPDRSLRQYAAALWQTRDGLPDGEIHSIVQTRDGYLWLGTQTGLARFDGVRFTVFNMTNTSALPASNIASLTEDSDGTLWICVPGGLVRYRNGRFARFDEEHGLQHPYVRALIERPTGPSWVSTGGSGIWAFDGSRFTQLEGFAEERWPPFVEHLTFDHRRGVVWAATSGGVLRLGPETGRLLTVADGLPTDAVGRVFVDRSGRVWAGTSAGLAYLDEGRFRSLGAHRVLSRADVRALTEDRDGNLWVGTRHRGLHRLAPGAFTASSQTSARWGERIFSIAEDDQGTLWVGAGNGLSRLEDGAFTTFGSPEGLANEDILCVLGGRDGSIVFVDSGGAARRMRRGRIETLLPRGTLIGGVPSVAETEGGLYLSGRALHRLRGADRATFSLGGREITALTPDGDGLLLAARGPEGVFRLWRFEAARFSPLFHDVSLPYVHVHNLRRDSQGRIWVATEGGGVYCVLPDGTHRVLDQSSGLPHDTAYGLHVDSEDRVWVTTRRGLACITDGRVFAFSRDHGMPVEAFFGILEDAGGSLWMPGDSGILRVSLEDLGGVVAGSRTAAQTTRFNTEDGLRSVTLSWRGSGLSEAADGSIWFATASGLASVDPRHLEPNPVPPRACVETLTVDGRPLPVSGPVVLPPAVDRIEIEYTGLGLKRPARATFSHRLDGHSEEWMDAGRRRSAVYTNLPAGRYEFMVRAASEDRVWSATSATLAFEIRPYWYQSPWIRMLLVALAFAAIWVSHRLRVGRFRRREEELRKRVDERTRELSDEVDERMRVEAALRHLAGELEERVRVRTTELVDINRQLERDIEDRRRAERSLAAEKDRLAVTLRSIGDGVVATDTDGRVLLMNRVAEQLCGHPLDTIVGKPLAEIHGDGSCRRQADLARQAIERRLPVESAEVVSADGTERLVALSAAPIHDDEGTVVGAVLVIRDVTEQRRVEEELKRAERMGSLALLAGGIAHDFNNLLTGVFGYVDLARARLGDPERARGALESAVSTIEKARALTSQLLTFTKAGKPAVAPFDLRGKLKDSARFALSGSNVGCEVEIAEDLWACLGDAHQIAQVIDNLLINARQAMVAGGSISLRARNETVPPEGGDTLAPGRYVRIEVSDQGSGIPPEIRDRVFEPFFTTKPTGTGLGLATAYSIVRRHGGEIDCLSEPNEGTTFRVRLPAAKEPPRAAAPGKPAAASRTGRILVMDDEEYVRTLAAECLQPLGHEIQVAASGEEAIERFRVFQRKGMPFDLVILDLTVPAGAGGVEVVAELKTLDPRIRAIASSGYSTDPVMADPASYGFLAALPKPYTLDQLVETVSRVLANPAH
jgi:PAS domain S-box-containing protein